ncbi:MAG: hypothetical protein AAFZ65_11680 [Planctomycetota bacterium]
MKATGIEGAVRRLRALWSVEAASAALALALLVGLEAGGRHLPAEWSVLPATAVAGVATALLVAGVREGRLDWPRRLGERMVGEGKRLLSVLRHYAVRGGVDLRGTPRLEREMPGALLLGAPLPWGAAFLVAAAGGVPHAVLYVASSDAFLVHWLSLLGLWTVGLGVTLVHVLVALGTLHDVCFEPRRRAGRMRPEREYVAQALVAGGVCLGAFLVPPVVLLGVTALGLLAALACLLPALGPDLDRAWVSGDAPQPRACSFLGTLALRLLFWSGIAVFAAVGLLGPHTLPAGWAVDLPDGLHQLTLTPLLGRLLAGWLAAAAVAMVVFLTAEVALPRLAFARAARNRQVLRLSAPPDPRTVSQLIASLRHTDYALRFGRQDRRAGDVRVDLRTALRLSFAASGGRFEDRDVLALRHSLSRRAERVHRRALLRAMPRLLEIAERERPVAAEGLWIGPQHWFERAVTAPAETETLGRRYFDADVGPPFSELLDWRTRVYWQGVCARLEVDHLFVERGIAPEALAATVEQMFEVEDVFGGRARLEERHLRAIPGVQAMIHELPGEGPWLREEYPEPNYEELARARILHLFRDRGGEPERSLPSSPSRSRPLSPRVP